MSQPSAPLFIVPKPSSRLRRFLIVLHGLAAFAALANDLPLWGKPVAMALVGFSARHHLRKARLSPIAYVILGDEANLRVGLAGGTEIEARLLPGTVVSRWLVVLQFRDPSGRCHSFTLLPDSVDREAYRSLCARLRAVPLPV